MVKRKTHRMSAGRRPKTEQPTSGTRADILSAARRVFAQRGFDGTSVREVAEAAGVNKAMIYYHFKDKVDLYRSVLSDSFEAMRNIWDHEVFNGGASTRQMIKVYIEGFIRFQLLNEDLRKILTMEFAASGATNENMKWIAKNYFSNNYATLAAILRKGMKNGELKTTDPLLAVVSLIGMIIHALIFMPIAFHIQGKKINISAAKLGSFVTDIFFDGLSMNVNIAKRQVTTKDLTL